MEMQLNLETVEEIPLPSGRMTKGVVRVGNTVRRPTKESSAFVARLLAHLETSACVWAPRYLGRDEASRDILSYIPGATPEKWGYFSDVQLGHAARIIRELHELTRGSDLSDGAVVCHNDPGPNNFVFVEDVPVAIIDFDMACPGEPLEDLGYMAWSWCISSNPKRGPVGMQACQVRTLADAYGANQSERQNLLDGILERQLRNVRFWSERLADPSSTPTSPAKMQEVIEWSKREAQYTEAHRDDFSRALLC
jgi:Ser/Thr protein kinase RdoA (MazF antagonist)